MYNVTENAGQLQLVVITIDPLVNDTTVRIDTIDGSATSNGSTTCNETATSDGTATSNGTATGEYYSILITIHIVYEQHVIHTGDKPCKDYQPGPYFVPFPAGETNALFIISINNDSIPEDNETFMITINSPSPPNGIMIASPSQAIVTIIDDDSKLWKDISLCLNFVLFIYIYTCMHMCL